MSSSSSSSSSGDQDAFVDYYAVLGITLSATAAGVRKAFLRKALATHPDKNLDLDPKVAEANFVLVQKANEVLSEVSTREAYNVAYFRWLRRGKSPAQDTTGAQAAAASGGGGGGAAGTAGGGGGGGSGSGGTTKRKSSPSSSFNDNPRASSSSSKKRPHRSRSGAKTAGSGRDGGGAGDHHHDWARYRADKARRDEQRRKNLKVEAAKRERQRKAKQVQVAEAQGAVQELYDERVGEGGAASDRSVTLRWNFPFERPRTTKKLRRLLAGCVCAFVVRCCCLSVRLFTYRYCPRDRSASAPPPSIAYRYAPPHAPLQHFSCPRARHTRTTAVAYSERHRKSCCLFVLPLRACAYPVPFVRLMLL